WTRSKSSTVSVSTRSYFPTSWRRAGGGRGSLNETESSDLQRHCRSFTERYIRKQRLWVLEVTG
ncbi:MAG: hypothetical protein AVDCRST_MAG86-1753, partial [uncultured Truepera sp.]